MQYFNDFNKIFYKFGDEVDTVVYQDLSQYTDIVDQVKDGISFLNFHTIQEGFRPDQVSLQLYGTPLNYWTFYLLNDDIREQGWPLTRGELDVYVKKHYPNTVITTRENISAKFKPGQTITGGTSGASGVILRRNLNLGQIVISGNVSFKSDGELLSSTNSSGVVETVTSVSSVKEYLAARHYVNADSEIVDVDPFNAPGVLLTERTNEEVEFNVNESLRTIRVVKPSLIGTLVSSYKQAIRE